jgi:hypothetical protein
MSFATTRPLPMGFQAKKTSIQVCFVLVRVTETIEFSAKNDILTRLNISLNTIISQFLASQCMLHAEHKLHSKYN